MKKYQAPLAQVMNFDNDYVVTGNGQKNNTKGHGCSIWNNGEGNFDSLISGGESSTSLDY
ncbi:MAG: hypothetical protein LUC94_01450 [Clostridiales bacterium]|nr:hypothetical protein [Clostridiales bacterium]